MKPARLIKILALLGVGGIFLLSTPDVQGEKTWLKGNDFDRVFLQKGKEYTWKIEVRDNYFHRFWVGGRDVQIWLKGPFTKDYRDIPGKTRMWTGVRNKPWQDKDNYRPNGRFGGEFIERQGTTTYQGYYLLKVRLHSFAQPGFVEVKHSPVRE